MMSHTYKHPKKNEHVYPDQDTGTYVVQLVIENSYGCLDSTTSDIVIKPENIILVKSNEYNLITYHIYAKNS